MVKFINNNDRIVEINFMGKYNLKLFNGDTKSRNNEGKIENVVLLHPLVQIKENNIYISYKEYDLKMCGFTHIDRIEIYKGSYFICSRDNVSNYHIKFPYFSSDGIYEIRTVFSNKDNTVKKCCISSFEFFGFKKEAKCNNLNINLTHQGRNLNITFPKKIGYIDLSNITLQDIKLLDSSGKKIERLVSKLHIKGNEIEVLFLDVFNDNKTNKLFPNEVYNFKISNILGELCSSFSFEYESLDVKLFSVVDKVYVEELSHREDGLLIIKLFIKLNNLINVDSYEYMVCNVWNKFLYLKSSDGEKNDTLVFECIIKENKGCFEFNLFNGSKLNNIIFDYDFSCKENYRIDERKYGDLNYIKKDKNKYDFIFRSECNHLEEGIKYFKFQNLEGEPLNTHIEGIELSEGEFLFKDINLSNKFSEIYGVDMGKSRMKLFVISNSIGIKFINFSYECSFDNTKIILNILNDNFVHGKALFKNGREEKFDIQDRNSDIRVYNKLDNQIIYLKCYDKNNKVYYSTLSFYNDEMEAYINNSVIERVYLGVSNELFVISKSLFNDFEGEFEAMIVSKNGEVINSIKVNGDENFKMCFRNIELEESDLYYLKVKGNERFKTYSIFIRSIISKENIYIRDLNNEEINLLSLNFKKDFVLNISLFIVIYGKRYMIMEGECNFNTHVFKENIFNKFMFNGNEYIFSYKMGDKLHDIKFTYIGNDREEYIYDLNY